MTFIKRQRKSRGKQSTNPFFLACAFRKELKLDQETYVKNLYLNKPVHSSYRSEAIHPYREVYAFQKHLDGQGFKLNNLFSRVYPYMS